MMGGKVLLLLLLLCWCALLLFCDQLVIATISLVGLLTWLFFDGRKNEFVFGEEEEEAKKKMFVVVVGGGAAGICAAVKLREQNIPFVVYEQCSNIGGTWWNNKYPGCACDVSSQIYSYSFHQKFDWSQSNPPQSEILGYLEETCDFYGIKENIKVNTRIINCLYNEDSMKWTVHTSKGDQIVCSHVVSAVGVLTIPKFPDIPGREVFKGDNIHTAQWKAGYEKVENKKVGVIGTGSSAAQLITKIVDRVNHLHVFQRSPTFVFPLLEYGFPNFLHRHMERYPIILKINRLMVFLTAETFYALFLTTRSRVAKMLTKLWRSSMALQINRDELKEKLLPQFEPGCKRTLLNNDYLSCFNKSNVSLIDTRIESITEKGVQLVGGDEIELDTLVYATGYNILNGVKNLNIRRKTDNRLLGELWGDCPNAYNGIMYPGFPNFFILLGPNTVLGHNSVIFMMECQVDFMIKAMLTTIKRHSQAIEVTEQANDDYQSYIERSMEKRVFTGNNCASWYTNSTGKNFTLWPNSCITYWWTTSNFNPKHFTFVRDFNSTFSRP